MNNSPGCKKPHAFSRIPANAHLFFLFAKKKENVYEKEEKPAHPASWAKEKEQTAP
jgi:hypothetical protein